MRKLIIVVLFVSLISCATTPREKQVSKRNSAVIDAPRETVWELLVEEVGMRFPVKIMDKDSGFISTDTVNMPGGYNARSMEKYIFNPTYCILNTWDGLRLSLSIKVSDFTPNRTLVKISAYYQAFEDNVSRSWLNAESNGYIEDQILTRLENRLGSIGVSNKQVIETGRVDQPKHITSQLDRLKSFLFLYCQSYESKELDKFAAFFTPDATENNRPFDEVLPEYRKNMEMVQSLNYRIELVEYSLQANTGNVKIRGQFFARYLLHGKGLKENTGYISMDLIKSGESYLVKRLNYTSGSEKKLDKQSQWGPWIETGNRE